MSHNKIALEDLNAEAEADALLAEEDERSRDDKRGERDSTLEDLEASESLPPPVQAIAAVRLPPPPCRPVVLLAPRCRADVRLLSSPSPRTRRNGPNCTRLRSSVSGSSSRRPLSS